MNARQFRWFLKEGFLRSHPQYLDQVAHYDVALRKMGLVADAIAAVVVALDRDTGKWGYQRVRWKRDTFDARTDQLVQAWVLITKGELPERDYDGNTWHCSPRYCRWSSLCWAGERPTSGQVQPGHGTLDARDLSETADLSDATDTWRVGKDLEVSGKAMQEEARVACREVLTRYDAKRLTVGGLTVTLVTSDRRSSDEKALRSFLTEEQLREAHRISPSTSLRVTDTEDSADS